MAGLLHRHHRHHHHHSTAPSLLFCHIHQSVKLFSIESCCPVSCCGHWGVCVSVFVLIHASKVYMQYWLKKRKERETKMNISLEIVGQWMFSFPRGYYGPLLVRRSVNEFPALCAPSLVSFYSLLSHVSVSPTFLPLLSCSFFPFPCSHLPDFCHHPPLCIPPSLFYFPCLSDILSESPLFSLPDLMIFLCNINILHLI